jgi:hypothetical protein
MMLLIMQFSPASFTSSLLGPNILILKTLSSDTPNLCTTNRVRDQVSHPYETTCKVIVRYISIFTVLDGRDKLIEW